LAELLKLSEFPVDGSEKTIFDIYNKTLLSILEFILRSDSQRKGTG
jgi:hypothetical protein